MYRLLLLLASNCAVPKHSNYSQAAPEAAFPVPALTPIGTGAPVVGQPGPQQPELYPRSPHERVLPPTREPGLWAGDEPRVPTTDAQRRLLDSLRAALRKSLEPQ